ncbi:hypothetical protein [Bacillus sp. FJAT-29937]|uniref:hypothetical protein n=1 Tax=Bacillus sp. FJAT-29937 TaxID=1720553 RepID=UPI00082A3D93|nr:hypothetical protein [Bacillus sp. FJAT-29937]
MIEITNVYFSDSKDPKFGQEIESEVILIDNKFVIDIDPAVSAFYTLTGEFNGIPVVDLAICKRFFLDNDISKNGVDLWEPMQMPLINVIEKLAK